MNSPCSELQFDVEMDNGDNVQTNYMENTPDSKEQGVSANNQIKEKSGNEEESVQLSHREAMAIWKEGLAEMIEVCIMSVPVGGGRGMCRINF